MPIWSIFVSLVTYSNTGINKPDTANIPFLIIIIHNDTLLNTNMWLHVGKKGSDVVTVYYMLGLSDTTVFVIYGDTNY